MADSFKLHLPADATYRTIVPEVAARYAELSGGSAADAAALTEAVTTTLDRLVNGAQADAVVDLAFEPDGDGVRVNVRCAGRQESIRVPIPVARS